MNHLIEDEYDDSTGQIFPATIYNAQGAEYVVGSQEQLDYHIINGWSLTKPDPKALIEETAGEAKQSDIVALSARVELLEKLVADMDERTGGDRTAELLKAHGTILAKLQKAVMEPTAKTGKQPAAVTPEAPEPTK
jgi:hypothetical protein